MSGGSLGYFYCDLENHIGDFGDKELDDLVRDLAKLFRAREWYLSSDTGKGSWVEERDRFKTKWFTPYSRDERIKKYIDEIRDEVLDAFGLSDKYCKNCKNWTPEADSRYGTCVYYTTCLTQRNESCEKFEAK